jgi:preprotein translocase subunit SecG
MLYPIFLVLHILISGLLMAVVLMQSGRGGGLAGAFGGGGGNQTLFGARGATTFLTKATWILGGGFMMTSLILALAIGNRQTASRPKSVLKENPPISAPATPGPTSSAPGSDQGGGSAPGDQSAPGAVPVPAGSGTAGTR